MNNIKYKILIMFCFLCLSCNTNKRKKTLCPYYPYEYNIEYENKRIIISYTNKDIEELYEVNGQYYEKRSNILILSTKKDTSFYLKDILRFNYKRIIKKENGEIDFSKDFFGKSTNLTVSGQLNVETYCAAFRNVYTFGPTFRAEYSNTARHASEFWMIEPEIAFGDLGANMELAEAMVKYIIKYVMDNCPEEMEFFNSFIEKGLFDKLNNVLNNDFGRVTYTEAIEILEKSGLNFLLNGE